MALCFWGGKVCRVWSSVRVPGHSPAWGFRPLGRGVSRRVRLGPVRAETELGVDSQVWSWPELSWPELR